MGVHAAYVPEPPRSTTSLAVPHPCGTRTRAQADISFRDLGKGPKWWGGVFHPPTQRIFATPAFESYVLVIDTKDGKHVQRAVQLNPNGG